MSADMIFKFTMATIVGAFTGTNFDVQKVSVKRPDQEIVAKLQKFEESFIYPFSDSEQFTIKHGVGGDYFAFFKRLGKPYFYTAITKENKAVKKVKDGKEVVVNQKRGEVAAAVCAVLRTLEDKKGKLFDAWYICDLKVGDNYRGEHLPIKLFKMTALKRFVQCPRGYAICMNPPTGEPKAASIFKKHGPVPNIKTETLNLYTLSADEVKQHRDALRGCLVKHRYIQPNERLGLVTTYGRKDYEIINKETLQRRPWQLIHMRPSTSSLEPQEGATHMICAVEGSALDNGYKNLLGKPSSTAQILSYGMNGYDFNNLSSDQI